MVATTASQYHRLFYKIAEFLCFNRVTIRQVDRLPIAGAVIYLGLHRNGALDGVCYLRVAPHAAYMVSAQLHRSALGRLLMPGIAISRPKDRIRGISADNKEAVECCVGHLLSGGQVFIMPEGTSTLGPQHLPFKPGAANIALEATRRGATVTLVPVAIHYECAWQWQSRVEVVVGEPFRLSPADELSLDELMQRIATSLEQTGVDVKSEAELRFIEMLAYAATLGTDLSYANCLKRLASGVPPPLREQADKLKNMALRAHAMTHQGVPLVPISSNVPYVLAFLILLPLMTAFFVLNGPPLLAGYFASRKLPDDLNVVAFWRAAIGIPSGLLWCVATIVLLLCLGKIWVAVAYLGVTWAGISMFYRFRKLTVAVHNSICASQIRQSLLAFHQALLRTLQNG